MNSIINSIKQIIQYISPTNKLPNDTKTQLVNFLKQLQKSDDYVDNDIMDELIVILTKGVVNRKIKEEIKLKTELLLDKLDGKVVVADDRNNDGNDIVNSEIDEVENGLDSEIEYYNKHTEGYPMYGITWNVKRQKWRLQHSKIDKYHSNLDLLAEEILPIICPKNLRKIEKIRTTQFINYQHKQIIIYNTLEQPLFDFRHIIKLLDIEREDIKYNDYKGKITHYGFKKNEFDGYIIKRFIPESVMYELIMSSNSAFSKNFKTDVSKILCELRKQGAMTIKNDQLVLASNVKMINNKPNYDKTNICDNDVKKQLDLVIHNHIHDPSYNNSYYCNMIKILIRNGAKISLQKYVNQHVMYFFVITISDVEQKNRIFCKIGYTADIIERIKSLKDEYKCEIYLVGLKYIRSEQQEKEFHKAIKISKNHLVYRMQINNRDKDEVYIFDELLYKEFNAVIETNKNIQVEEDDIDEYIAQLIKDQYMYFIKYLSSTSVYHFVNAVPSNPNEYYKDIMINYITLNANCYLSEIGMIDKKESRSHELVIRDKDILLKDKEIELINKQIELAKLKAK